MKSEKLPPHCLDSEKSALACILDCDQQQAEQWFPQLEERHFYHIQTRAIFRGLTRIETDGGQFNAVELIEQLKIDGQLSEAGGTEAIAGLDVTSSANFPSYLAVLNDRAARREAIQNAQKAIQDAQNLARPVESATKVTLLERLDGRIYSPTQKPEDPAPRFYLGGIGVATAGNVQTVSSQAKTGKTAVVGAMIGSATGTDGDFLGWQSENPSSLALVHFDTEQSVYDHWQLIDRAKRRARCDSFPSWLRSYCVTGFAPRENRAAIRLGLEQSAQKFGGIHSFILDGAADCVADVNDPAESNDFVAELHALAIQYNCPIIGVIHLNPGSDFKTRGHLGSQLERKAETNLKLEKDSNGVTVIWADKNRRAPILKKTAPCFCWSDEHQMHVTASMVADAKAAAKAEAVVEQIHEAFRLANATSLHWSELMAALLRVPGVRSDATAERIHKAAKDLGIIKRNLLKKWEMA